MAFNMKGRKEKDVLERMNYLYQASHLMAIGAKNPIAASYYGYVMMKCAQKSVLRMDPDVKRSVCKCCLSPLIPGVTAKVRLVSKPTKMVRWKCLICDATKQYPTKGGHELWADRPEALIEMLQYTPKPKKVTGSNRCKIIKKSVNASQPSLITATCELLNTIENLSQGLDSCVAEGSCSGSNTGNDLNQNSEVSMVDSMVEN
ncbi:ribonuclease P protein subunit p21 [Athalia rosae]|uniref:ribonuclease P protein subunit p21 n=1 Tax=Athalia rosae TaxID=37344 RepID=UPI002033B34B|nr:ribonuclease P protein subunit p21 [Athalia rosae]